MAMIEPTRLLTTALSLASGLVYVVVGVQVGRRDVSPESRVAMRMFQVWWFGLAALVGSAAIFQVLALLGYDRLWVALAWLNLIADLILAAFAGLVYYLLYLYTGKRVVVWPVAAFYLVLLVVVQTLLVLMRPAGFGIPLEGGSPTFLDEHGARAIPTTRDNPLLLLLSMAFVVPPIGAAIAYSLLFFRVHDRMSRFRIATVSGTLIAWFGTSLLASVLNWGTRADGSPNVVWSILSMAVSLTASILIYWAYKVPKWVQARLTVPAPS